MEKKKKVMIGAGILTGVAAVSAPIIYKLCKNRKAREEEMVYVLLDGESDCDEKKYKQSSKKKAKNNE